MAPTSNELSGSAHPHEEEYSDSYQTSSTNPSSSQHHLQPLGYPHQSTYYTTYSQPTAQRNIAQISYPYQPYSPIPGPSTSQLSEGPHSASSYVGSYGVSSQPAASHRSDPFYYAQPTPSPTTSTTTTEGSYGRQYMPFPQTHMGIPYPEPGQPSSSQLSLIPPPDQIIDDSHTRGEEVDYGSIASSYRHIITTVSQASPSPSVDSPRHSFDPPVVEDMLHRAVEGLRYLDPSRAEQYPYTGDFSGQPIASGAVGPEGSSETVFVRYYEDGKTEGNPMKKKVRSAPNSRFNYFAHEEAINVRMRQKRERKGATQCASCHATSTPEWRRGPLGPRTLCNACGLVYAKLMKKRAKEEEKLSPGGSPRRARSKGKSREVTEESEEDREQGSDDTLPPMAGPSGMSGGGYPP
ncbi:GATA zinc finger domain-containing protein 16 OS=Dictyostelium discoideum GN=gtaP PE=4 SV=1 [Rhizoctonia solani AG-1 IB]|uniref:GATA zinc finger domain-containing protein 16 n=1 Tax=Thanatephorus cucumeris (strain AG1-IB / isolate 7/3/14) TaxID=1108050 RepID=A0A0B7FVM1_THACB|nr:GATA zinc finger domain-containing protein 16 OS=Dictyostelium discoideum GN=gtaP PE=4 SV=1 [Rhizoctonia solani AG-1 IB]